MVIATLYSFRKDGVQAMAYRSRIYFADRQKSEIWDRWQRGESMSSIGRSFDRNSSSIHPLIARAGGFRPAERKRSRFALTLPEREEIPRGLGVGASLRQISCGLRRAPSTISREVHRNGGSGKYRAARSEGSAWDRALRSKLCKLACNQELCRTLHPATPPMVARTDCGLPEEAVPQR